MKIEGNIANYEPLTEEKLKEGLGLWQQIEPQNRKMYVQTGESGMKYFHRAMQRDMIDSSMQRLMQEGKMTLHEFNSITKMLDSPDDRDYELAKLIIDSKL